jgi:hypothetical protein
MRQLAAVATGAALIVTAIGGSAAHAQVVVTACGTEVSGDAVLGADLDCSGSCTAGVIIDNGATLHFNGFSLTGAAPSIPNCNEPVVECLGGCTLVGPGTIVGGAFGVCASEFGSCFTYEPRGKLVMTDMTVRDCRRTAVYAGYLRMENSVVSDTGSGSAVHAARSARISTSTIENNDFIGITGTRIRSVGSTIRNNGGDGLSIDNGSKLVDTVVSGNGGFGIRVSEGRIKLLGGFVTQNATDGVISSKATVEGTTISDNGGSGLRFTTGRVVGATIVGNADAGIRCRTLKIADGQVSGNCSASPDPVECADFVTCRLRADDVECETSLCRGQCLASECAAGQSFGICSAD